LEVTVDWKCIKMDEFETIPEGGSGLEKVESVSSKDL
jgi:hypothetical protein